MVISKLRELELRWQRHRYERIPFHSTCNPVNWNSDVLVDVTKLVEPPEKMVLHIGGGPAYYRAEEIR